MGHFYNFIQNVPEEFDFSPEKIRVAVIDDGVYGFNEDIQEHIACGVSFCSWPGSQDSVKAYYLNNDAHGTQMSSLICSICPQVKLYIARLGETVGAKGERQIITESAVGVSFPHISSAVVY